MKTLFLVAILLSLTSCGTLQEMNSNMKRSNALMSENLVVVRESKERIEENTVQVTLSTETMARSTENIQNNTEQVVRSTETMKEFEDLIADNTETINKIFKRVEGHPYFMPLAFIAILALLFLPSIILLILSKKILRSLKK